MPVSPTVTRHSPPQIADPTAFSFVFGTGTGRNVRGTALRPPAAVRAPGAGRPREGPARPPYGPRTPAPTRFSNSVCSMRPSPKPALSTSTARSRSACEASIECAAVPVPGLRRTCPATVPSPGRPEPPLPMPGRHTTRPWPGLRILRPLPGLPRRVRHGSTSPQEALRLPSSQSANCGQVPAPVRRPSGNAEGRPPRRVTALQLKQTSLTGCTDRSRSPPAERPGRSPCRTASSRCRRSRRPSTSRPWPPRSARPGCCGSGTGPYRPG